MFGLTPLPPSGKKSLKSHWGADFVKNNEISIVSSRMLDQVSPPIELSSLQSLSYSRRYSRLWLMDRWGVPPAATNF
jgi:hypothetical protein